MVDLHTHLGYRKGATFRAENFTRENLLDQLQRFASYGVAAVASAGTDRGDLTFTAARPSRRTAPLVRTAGPRARAAGRRAVAADARRAVRRVDRRRGAARRARARRPSKVDFVKIWVDDRNGTVPKLSPALYRAIIDEAHKHKLRVFAHIATLADAKDLLRAGRRRLPPPGPRSRRRRRAARPAQGSGRTVFFALTLFAPRLHALTRRGRRG